jgi:mRNA interferase RelE/StbE
MPHRIEFTATARKDLWTLGVDLQQRIANKIDALARQPRPRGVEKLQGRENRYRIRVGDYRVIYEVHDEVLLIVIVRVGHRREWEGEDGTRRTLTYAELHREINRTAGAMRGLGLMKGDVMAVFMPMLPEIVIGMFTANKLGAIVLPLFFRYGAEAVASRC